MEKIKLFIIKFAIKAFEFILPVLGPIVLVLLVLFNMLFSSCSTSRDMTDVTTEQSSEYESYRHDVTDLQHVIDSLTLVIATKDSVYHSHKDSSATYTKGDTVYIEKWIEDRYYNAHSMLGMQNYAGTINLQHTEKADSIAGISFDRVSAKSETVVRKEKVPYIPWYAWALAIVGGLAMVVGMVMFRLTRKQGGLTDSIKTFN